MLPELDPAETQETESISLRDELANALKEVTERDSALPESEAAETPGAPKEDRPRDESGRFAAKEGSAPAKPEAAPQEPAKVETPPKPAATPSVKAPQSWSTAAKADFDKLPPHIQAEIAKRESDVEKGFTRQDEERQFGRSLRDIINPYMPIITAEGGTPQKAVQELLNTAYLLRRGTPEQKVALFRATAQQFGIPLDQLVQAPNFDIDPKVQTLQQRLDQMERDRQAEKDAREAEMRYSLQREVDAFAADPKHEHYDKVTSHMAALLAGGAAKDMQDAYDQACWANAEVRSTLEAQRIREADEKRKADAAAKALQSKRAAVSVTGAPGAAVPANHNPERSLRDELAANFAAAQGRL